MKTLTIAALTLVFSSISMSAYSMDMAHGMSHADNAKLTAVQSKRMQTENDGPSTNDWATGTRMSSQLSTTKSAGMMGHTAVQHNRMKTENDGPNTNDWVLVHQGGKQTKTQASSGELGLTAVQLNRMKTEDDSASSNDWVKVTQR